MRASKDRIALWQGECHSRLFGSLEFVLWGDFRYNGVVKTLPDDLANFNVDEIVQRAGGGGVQEAV